mmetsp:Transcript_11406/g.33096  ORF Transcript_11406/g.33096 Transcript_11406/m.33096 type:complete len:242 (+) Transcript_11406:316-1041(+)
MPGFDGLLHPSKSEISCGLPSPSPPTVPRPLGHVHSCAKGLLVLVAVLAGAASALLPAVRWAGSDAQPHRHDVALELYGDLAGQVGVLLHVALPLAIGALVLFLLLAGGLHAGRQTAPTSCSSCRCCCWSGRGSVGMRHWGWGGWRRCRCGSRCSCCCRWLWLRGIALALAITLIVLLVVVTIIILLLLVLLLLLLVGWWPVGGHQREWGRGRARGFGRGRGSGRGRPAAGRLPHESRRGY